MWTVATGETFANEKLAPPPGLEPGTHGLGIHCSVHY
jgi:hypothetical protein